MENKITKKEKFWIKFRMYIIIFLLTLNLMGIILILADDLQKRYQYKLCEAGGLELEPDDFLSGIYKDESYYCVLTKNRTNEQINATEYHEMCHVVIDRDFNHFCNNPTTLNISENNTKKLISIKNGTNKTY